MGDIIEFTDSTIGVARHFVSCGVLYTYICTNNGEFIKISNAA